MRLKQYTQLILIIFFSCFISTGFSQTVDENYSDGVIYLRYAENVDIFWEKEIFKLEIDQFKEISRIKDNFGIYEIENTFWFSNNKKLGRTLKIKYSEIEKADELVRKLSKKKRIELVEKIPIVTLDVTPNDPDFNSSQWYLNHINAEQAWDITTGSSSIDVAVIDNGVQTNHPDLSTNLLNGWDVADSDSNPSPETNSHSHGTHVSGIVGANTNNSLGIASLGWNIDVMPIKAAETGAATDIITHGYSGIVWAGQNGAEIINCSWGSTGINNTQELSLLDAIGNGAIIVASAGNDGSSTLKYPAGFSNTNVIAVANTTSSDAKASSSNFGSWVDISAPGTFIRSTTPGSNYATFSGTSQAAPLVSALLGLVWSLNPSATRQEVINCVFSTAVSLSWSGGGAGRIDAFAAVSCMNGDAPPNDDCAGTMMISYPNTCINNFDASDATQSLGAATCSGITSGIVEDIWFSFVATETDHTIIVTPSNGYDPVIEIRQGPSCSGSFIGCIDQGGGDGFTESVLINNTQVGQTYHVRIYHYDPNGIPPTTTTFNICIDLTDDGGGGGEDIYITNENVSPSQVSCGDPITMSCTHNYSGNQSDSNLPSFNLDYYISSNTTLDGSDLLLSDDISSLGSDDISHNETETATLPNNLSTGTYYILFVGDADDELSESNENNNIAYVQIQVVCGGGGGEDIFLTNENVSPSQATCNAAITMSCTHNYSGSQLDSNLPSFNLDYYLSTNTSLDGSDLLLSDDISSLGSDDIAHNETETVTLPDGLDDGLYYILFIGDADDELAESNENNNIAYVPIQISCMPEPEDIYLTNVSVSPTNLDCGDNITMSCTQNYAGSQMDADLPSFDVDYYFSTNTIFDNSDILLSGDISGLGIDDPANDEVGTGAIPTGISDGTYYILFVSDAESELVEVNENNNIEFIQIQVSCAPISYTINTSSNPTNGGTTSGAGNYDSGSSATVIATANAGWVFMNWTENGAVVSTNNNYQFTVNSNRNLVANFSQNDYIITTTSNPTNGGSTSGSGSYSSGSSVTVIATANAGWAFMNWTENGAVVSTNNNYQFTINSSRNLVANFSQNDYIVTTTSNPTNGGSTSGAGSYSSGSSVTVSAIANAGWTFLNWTNNGNGTIVSTNSNYQFTINSNRNLIANFSQNNYTISTSSSPSNGGIVSGAGNYNSGSSVTVSATANTGWAFMNWTENGTIVSTSASYQFTVNSSRSLVANFTQETYTIVATTNPSTAGTIAGAGTYIANLNATINVVPNASWQFINWTENGVIVHSDPTYEFQVSSDRNLVANFYNTTAVENINDHINVELFPNPLSDWLHIKINSGSSTNIEKIVVIYDATGKKIRQFTFYSNETSLELSALAQGVYFVHLKTGDWTKVFKVSKIH